jgi:histidinol-phosphatase
VDAVADNLEIALELADLADSISMRRFGAADLSQRRKADTGIVTEVDLAIEQAMRELLSRTRPSDAILGEESGRSGAGARTWMLDPIDGTDAFVAGGTDWSTLISLVEDDVPVVGVVSHPSEQRRWWAGRGLGAFGDGTPISVSTTDRMAEARLCDDFRVSIGQGLENNPLPGLARLCAWVHPYHDRLDFLRIAEGDVDLVVGWHAGAGPDLFSQVCIVIEAGGRFSDLAGRLDVDADVWVVSNGTLHDEAVRFLNEVIARGEFDPAVRVDEDIPRIKQARGQQPNAPFRPGA